MMIFSECIFSSFTNLKLAKGKYIYVEEKLPLQDKGCEGSLLMLNLATTNTFKDLPQTFELGQTSVKRT